MRVSKILWFLLVFLSGMLALVIGVSGIDQKEGTPAKPLPEGKRKIEVEFKVPLEALAKDMPGKLMVYRCSPDSAGKTQRTALKQVFGEKGHLETHRTSGGVFAADLTRLWVKPPKFGEEGKAPAEEKTRSAGEAFLRKINGIPEGKTKIKVSTDIAELKDRQGKKQSIPMAPQVTYRRVLNGYDVLGPGGKIKVYQDLQGEVTGYLRVWRKLTPGKEMPLITVSQAAEKFKKSPLGGALLADVVKVEVRGIRLAYLERSLTEPQGYLQPIFFFDCVAHLKGKERMEEVPYTRYMEALVKPPEPLFLKGRDYKSAERPKTLPKSEKESD